MRSNMGALKFMAMGLAAGVTLVLAARCGPSDSDAQSTGTGTTNVTVAPPADTDSTRLMRGSVYITTQDKVVVGPFVLTDISTSTNGISLYLSQSTCGPPVGGSGAIPNYVGYVGSGSDVVGIHGARIYIPSGSTLCASSTSANVGWSGFRPY